MNTSEMLHKSADLIRRDGWWHPQHPQRTSSDGPPRCTANAIRWANGPEPFTVAHRAFMAYLGVESVSGIFTWNDAPERTAEDVVAALRAAAAVEELREAEARGPLHTTGPTVRVPTQPGVGVA